MQRDPLDQTQIGLMNKNDDITDMNVEKEESAVELLNAD